MPRHLRFVVPDVPLHIIQRGVNKGICFRDDADRMLFLGLLEEHAPASGCDMHAYVLMDNHVHLLATPRAHESPSLMMKRTLEIYSRHFNKKYDRCGTLWGGRYKSSLVDETSYLFVCYRYIELNPVRAGMVADPASYPWSSYGANALARPSWLSPHRAYLDLGSQPAQRAAAYRGFVDDAIPLDELQAIRIAIRGGLPLGSPEFVRRVRKQCECATDEAIVPAAEKVV
jgi:putative transposase